MTYERSRGDRYALSALKNKRATIASEIVQTERHLRHLRENLVHVDAALLILDPNSSPEMIRNKRPTRRVKLFRQGELGRMIIDTLRRAGEPVSTRHVVDEALRIGGHGEDARKALASRIRGNLAYQERRGAVSKLSSGTTALWTLQE